MGKEANKANIVRTQKHIVACISARFNQTNSLQRRKEKEDEVETNI